MRFEWSEEKNRLLKDSRDVTFEDVLLCIDDGRLLDVVPLYARIPFGHPAHLHLAS